MLLSTLHYQLEHTPALRCFSPETTTYEKQETNLYRLLSLLLYNFTLFQSFSSTEEQNSDFSTAIVS